MGCQICSGEGHVYSACPLPLIEPRSRPKPHESTKRYHRRLRYNEYQRLWQSRNISAVPVARDKRNQQVRDRHEKNPETQRKRNRRANDRGRSRLDEAKGAPCLDCGNCFPPECMDFDHRPGEEKLFSVGTNMRRSWATIQAEIAKCDLVCSNCHRTRTVTRKREHLKAR